MTKIRERERERGSLREMRVGEKKYEREREGGR